MNFHPVHNGLQTNEKYGLHDGKSVTAVPFFEAKDIHHEPAWERGPPGPD